VDGVRIAHTAFARLFLLAVAVQFLLAGFGVFGAQSYDAHRGFGFALPLFLLLLIVLAAIGRMGAQMIGMAVVLLLLVLLQSFFVAFEDTPRVAALHVVNALVIGVGAQQMAQLSADLRKAARPGAG
jgi:hypothetical protein